MKIEKTQIYSLDTFWSHHVYIFLHEFHFSIVFGKHKPCKLTVNSRLLYLRIKNFFSWSFFFIFIIYELKKVSKIFSYFFLSDIIAFQEFLSFFLSLIHLNILIWILIYSEYFFIPFFFFFLNDIFFFLFSSSLPPLSFILLFSVIPSSSFYFIPFSFLSFYQLFSPIHFSFLILLLFFLSYFSPCLLFLFPNNFLKFLSFFFSFFLSFIRLRCFCLFTKFLLDEITHKQTHKNACVYIHSHIFLCVCVCIYTKIIH